MGYQILLLGVLLLYTGLATKIFNVYNCTKINGIDGHVLAADFAIKCYEEKHSIYLIVAVGFLLVYILGIPLAMFVVLWRNRNNLHFENESEELTKKHLAMKARLGGLYLQYEPKYWWFEMVVILQKMVMTGAMCVVAQGSSVQLLIAILVMLAYMLLVLKTAPYEEDSEDWSAFVACVALTLTTIGGFALMTDNPNARTYESKVLGLILIGINVVCIALEIFIVVIFDCDGLSLCKKICGGKVIETKNGKVDKNNKTKVQPIEDDIPGSEQHKTLRDTRLKYGADSEEYKEVALNIQTQQPAELKQADVT